MIDQGPKPELTKGIATPVPHVLALAPIDVWIRMLVRSGGVRPRYWLRLAFTLCTSLIGTVITIPERLILGLIRKIKFKSNPQVHHPPGAIIILGYYRSGTTHLHNLISCDQRLVTPRWYHALAGQGFWIGWSLIRFILVPFLAARRPQDSVGFGPSWPAEDDFALCTWGGCSSIPGRLIWPSKHEHWKRWHDLEGLNEKELNQWRSLMAMFVWKLTRGRSKSRIVLLKSPSHTARIAELDHLFKGNVKFIHLVREPQAVIDSNVRLHESLAGHLLEDEPDVQMIRDQIVDEYAQTEARCREQAQDIADDRFVRLRYQDLRNDAVGSLKAAYQALGLGWNQQTESSIKHYLGALGPYSSTKAPIELGQITPHEHAVQAEMVDCYQLNEPSISQVSIEPQIQPRPRSTRGGLVALTTAIGFGLLWVSLVWIIHSFDTNLRMRLIPMVWVCGALIGLCTQRASGIGSHRLGLWAGVLTVLVALSVAFPITVINWNWANNTTTSDWLYHNTKGGIEGLRSISSIVLMTLGAITAYRHASWQGPHAPGTKSPKANPRTGKAHA